MRIFILTQNNFESFQINNSENKHGVEHKVKWLNETPVTSAEFPRSHASGNLSKPTFQLLEKLL